MSAYLIVGLGNPGQKYKLTRHNIGFMLVDALLENMGNPPLKTEHKAEVAKVHLDQQQVIFAKPQTSMNLSGDSVQALVSYYNIELEHILVIHDDIDQAYQSLRLHKARGHGGQNGVRDIHAKLGTNNYSRLKLGIGRPSNPRQDVASYVLESFTPQEMAELPDYLSRAAEALDSFIFEGFDKAASKFNQR